MREEKIAWNPVRAAGEDGGVVNFEGERGSGGVFRRSRRRRKPSFLVIWWSGCCDGSVSCSGSVMCMEVEWCPSIRSLDLDQNIVFSGVSENVCCDFDGRLIEGLVDF